MRMLYLDIENQITRVDGKAQLVLSTNAILGAVVASFGLNPGLIERLEGNTLALTTIIAYLCFFAALLCSVIFALLAAFPNLGLRPSRHLTQTSDALNMFNSAHITLLDKERYEERFRALAMNEVKRDVILQIHAKSLVVQSKYRRMQTSLRFLIVGLFLLALASTLQLLLTG
jgi:hypothetical protein